MANPRHWLGDGIHPRHWLAEGIATFCLVFFGVMSIIISKEAIGSGLTLEANIMISLGHGSAIGLMVYAFGHVSGAHINPAVTIPMMITKKIGIGDGIGYIILQLVGAVIAALVLSAFFPVLGEAVNFGVQTGPSDLIDFDVMKGLGLEIILTFFLVTVIYMVAVHKRAIAGTHGITIGGMIFLLHLVGVPFTGASMNPARTFGPALVSGFWEFHWIYWVGPIIGGIIAGLIMNYIYVKKEDTEE